MAGLTGKDLGPPREDLDAVLEAQRAHGAPEEVGPLLLRIEEGPSGTRPSFDRQHEARKTTARTQIEGKGGTCALIPPAKKPVRNKMGKGKRDLEKQAKVKAKQKPDASGK